ncbi:CDP-diacylglycerol--glycerol-3-phosphate 3-phosphatidyltransferase [Geodermatophilus amargosae]|uniref:CDP-diacylglycerol--glycerol-3-phosphate 3-phosphatidyltransferase n=1 Tax=Geodermatophilus amargosae TaxID=1296565 RepID=A0A1I6Z235_9ACTN|nr:CDP-alcohol phosphatidyltransferase family protein [Geodermatophilus amargosae]SFT56752.1 CDP-diacylglycerol--glycerol-3-phosphate 3-phosphatidyltransferase [Geodermatophilus amargosae]
MTSSQGPSAAVPVTPAAGTPVVSDRNALPDRVWTVPNALSVLRLLGVPLFLWLLLGPREDGWAVVVLMVAGVSDWADGKLARVLGQSSRLGALLDPAADRLYIIATLVAFVLRDVVPLWVVAVLVGREVVLGLMLLVLRVYGYEPLQVHYLGKAATFNLLYAFPLLLLADDATGAWLAWVQPVAWAFTIWGGALYVLSGVFYVVQVAGIVRAERAGTPGGTTPGGTRPGAGAPARPAP